MILLVDPHQEVLLVVVPENATSQMASHTSTSTASKPTPDSLYPTAATKKNESLEIFRLHTLNSSAAATVDLALCL